MTATEGTSAAFITCCAAAVFIHGDYYHEVIGCVAAAAYILLHVEAAAIHILL